MRVDLALFFTIEECRLLSAIAGIGVFIGFLRDRSRKGACVSIKRLHEKTGYSGAPVWILYAKCVRRKYIKKNKETDENEKGKTLGYINCSVAGAAMLNAVLLIGNTGDTSACG